MPPSACCSRSSRTPAEWLTSPWGLLLRTGAVRRHGRLDGRSVECVRRPRRATRRKAGVGLAGLLELALDRPQEMALAEHPVRLFDLGRGEERGAERGVANLRTRDGVPVGEL